ncbi:hypothetical protein MMC14_008624 [Varicellaria rhodocarpa]|nr:hypothetical protein [Varicellaria rhodocarpa]
MYPGLQHAVYTPEDSLSVGGFVLNAGKMRKDPRHMSPDAQMILPMLTDLFFSTQLSGVDRLFRRSKKTTNFNQPEVDECYKSEKGREARPRCGAKQGGSKNANSIVTRKLREPARNETRVSLKNKRTSASKSYEYESADESGDDVDAPQSNRFEISDWEGMLREANDALEALELKAPIEAEELLSLPREQETIRM